jgi:hypothetical protein
LHRSKRKNRQAGAIFKREADQKCASLRNVLSKDVKNELLDVVEDTTPFFNGGENRGEVVVRENNVRCFLLPD